MGFTTATDDYGTVTTAMLNWSCAHKDDVSAGVLVVLLDVAAQKRLPSVGGQDASRQPLDWTVAAAPGGLVSQRRPAAHLSDGPTERLLPRVQDRV